MRDVRTHSGYGGERCTVHQLLLHAGYPLVIPGCLDDVRYRRYGIVTGYGRGCERIDLRTYERRAELRAGKGTKQALAEGYKNAFSAIFDSNLTSIITGVILFNFGTGPIRGFATTLIIGILCSFFSAVFLTRLVYEHFMNRDKWLHLTFTTGLSKNLMQNVHYNFMGITKRSFTIWGVVIVVCIISFFVRGLAQSIDFTGGRNFVVQFEQVVQCQRTGHCFGYRRKDYPCDH